jgi:hypothetical protein
MAGQSTRYCSYTTYVELEFQMACEDRITAGEAKGLKSLIFARTVSYGDG